MAKVRNRFGGAHTCCWEDCEKPGDTRHEHRERREPHDEGEAAWLKANPHVTPQRIYVFCSERHLTMWRNSYRDHKNLPTGSRGMLG